MKHLETALAGFALLTGLTGGVVTVEGRYAKADDLDSLYAKTLRLRIMELQLKSPQNFTTADSAMLEFLKRELAESEK